MSFKQNLHTHTTFCDGKNTPEEMVERAIELGFDAIGFSGHSYREGSKFSMSVEGTEEYKKEIARLKEKYSNQIEVYLGIELEMLSETNLSGYDYIIGAKHYFNINGQHVGFDRSASEVKAVIDKYFGGDGLKFAKKYYEELYELTKYNIDIVAHFDLITKNCEKQMLFDVESKEYRRYALDSLSALVEKIKIFEVNTGAMARGYRTSPYPMPFILKELKNLGGKVTISSDCHDKNYLNYYFDESIQLVKSCGFDKLTVLSKGEFKEIKI